MCYKQKCKVVSFNLAHPVYYCIFYPRPSLLCRTSECLEFSSRPISFSKSMSPTSVRLASTIFVHSRHFRRMLSAESAATLVHAFVTSRVDYCNVVLDVAPKVITNKLQRVMNAAGTRKFDRGLTQLMHDNLHWLDVPERVKYKVIILTRRCLIGTATR